MRRRRPLAEQHLAHVVLEQERLGDDQPVEHSDDVAIRQADPLAPLPGTIAVPDTAIVQDFKPRERRALDPGGAEEAHHRAAWLQQPHDLRGKHLSRSFGEEVEDVPAEDAVDAAVRMGEPGPERRCQVFRSRPPEVAVHVRHEILYEQLAPEPLAAERHVGAGDRPEIKDDGGVLPGQRGGEFLEGLGRDDGFFRRRGCLDACRRGVGTAGSPLE